LSLVVDFSGVTGYGNKKAPIGAEIDVALDQAQVLVLRAARVTLTRFGFAGRSVRRQPRQVGIPQRAGGMYLRRFGVEARDLPVPTGQRQVE
jgi:hypothetical protein